MDKNPRPMREFRPVETVDNATDQFKRTHQERYEAMAKPSRDRVETVDNHNRACPKLEDELKKRRSILRVTTDKASRSVLKIGACGKSTIRNRTKNNITFKRKAITLKSSNKKTTIDKKSLKNYKNMRKNHKVMVGTCPRCLSALRKEKQMPFRLKRSIQNIFTAKEFDKSQSDDAVSLRAAKKTRPPKRNRSSIESSNYPDTSNQSFVSYHSFASMDKEPMVD